MPVRGDVRSGQERLESPWDESQRSQTVKPLRQRDLIKEADLAPKKLGTSTLLVPLGSPRTEAVGKKKRLEKKWKPGGVQS